MRRWVAGGAVAALLVLAALLVAVHNAGRWIESHREWIATRAAEVVGREVSFGRIGVSVFPSIAVRLADVRLGDDPAWSSEPFVAAASAQVSVAALPALLGRVVVRRVTLERPVITVIRGAAGRNVDSLGRRLGLRTDAGEGRSEDGAPPVGRGPETATGGRAERRPRRLPFVVAAARVRDGRVRLVDRRRDDEAVIELHDVDGTVTGVASDRAASIDARAALPGAARQNVTLAGTVGPLDLAALGELPIAVELRADAVDVAQLRAAVPEVAAAVPRPLGIDGPVAATVEVSGAARTPAFEARLDATAARVIWAEWFAKPPGVPLTMDGTGQRVGSGARLEGFALRLGDLVATGRGEASPERVAMHVDVEPTALEALTALLPALAKRRVSGAIGLSVNADGAVTEGRTPALTGTVTLRDVSVASSDPPFEVAGLTQTIALEGDVAVLPETSMRVNGMPVVASGRAGRFGSPVVGLSDLDIRIFGGRVRGRVEADRTRPARPRLAADVTLDDIDVAAAAAARAPKAASTLAGRLSGAIRLAGRGADERALRESLAGDGRFVIDDGVLRGVNLVDRVLGGVTRVPGLGELVPERLRTKYPAVFGGEDTRFEELTAVWTLADRVVRLERVAVAARDFGVDGRGTLTLDGRLSATGGLRLSEGLSDDVVDATRVAAVLRGARGRVVVPFAVEGTWPRVRVTPDVKALARTVQGGALQQGIDRLLDGLFKKR